MSTQNSSPLDELQRAKKVHRLAFFVSLILGVLATAGAYAVWKTGNDVQNAAQNESDARIQGATSDAQKANRELRALQLRLKERSISADQSEQFIQLTKHIQKGPLTIAPTMTDLEAVGYAEQLKAMLERAGWKPKYDPLGANGLAYSGLVLIVHSKAPVGNQSQSFHAIVLSNALLQSHIPHAANEEKGIPDGSAILVVGHKPLSE